MLDPEQCPRFHSCSAAICPLASTLAAHLPGEPVCFYLRASGKQGAAERFRDDPVFAACLARLPVITAKSPDIRRRVELAARSGFKGGHLVRSTAETA